VIPEQKAEGEELAAIFEQKVRLEKKTSHEGELAFGFYKFVYSSIYSHNHTTIDKCNQRSCIECKCRDVLSLYKLRSWRKTKFNKKSWP
jgi:hypothetical protein